MRVVACIILALGLVACVETALDAPAGHPADPSVFPGAATQPPAALASGFDPFAAFSNASAAAPSTTPPSAGTHAGHDHATHEAPAAAQSASAPAENGAAYTCPMHPEIVRDAPGSCPICGMKLVPKK